MPAATDFADFFAAVHGHEPFPWQASLVDEVLAGDGVWPGTLDLPTGSGKTAVLDVAVFTLAVAAAGGVAGAGPGGVLGLPPRRIVLVVDRRVVVDQAADRADRLAEALAAEDRDERQLVDPTRRRQEAVRRDVRETLLDLTRAGTEGQPPGQVAGGTPPRREHAEAAQPLHRAVMRGGIPRDDNWAARPDQATILLSTVDQVGSRLLFRGYGVSDRMRPVHAGLLGCDTLFLLDEVHLSSTFAATLQAVRGYLAESGQHPASWQVVEMSATPGASAGRVFQLGRRDRDPAVTEPLARRLSAIKHAELVDVKEAGDAADVLPDAVARRIGNLGGTAIAVVVNRVETARRTAGRLAHDGIETLLLTGRMRPLDRDDQFERYRNRMAPGRARRDDDERFVVVATQSIEAGADLDFDAMITECAPIDSLRQRFGRLDRLGDLSAGSGPAQAVVLAPKATVGGKEPDPVYGDALRSTYQWLKRRHRKGTFDVGPESEDLRDAPPGAAPLPEPGPMLLPGYVDRLAQTWPRPQADPDVSLWLHGFREADLDVTVVWRADLTPWHLDTQLTSERATAQANAAGTSDATDAAPATTVVAACPPAAPEAMQVPLGAARAWLRHLEEVAVADVEGMVPAPDDKRRMGNLVLRWRGPEDTRVVYAADLRPGDTVVVPASYGGISQHNWNPRAPQVVADLGDRAQLVQRNRATLRLHPDVLPEAAPRVEGVAPETEPDDLEAALEAWLRKAAEAAPEDSALAWFREAAAHLRDQLDRALKRSHWVPGEDGSAYLVLSLQARDHAIRASATAADDLDGSDLTNSFIGCSEVVLLDDHLRGVGALAWAFARRCGLPEEVASDLCLAGELHDLGKADPRFQRWLHGGDEIAARGAGADIAKSAYDSYSVAARQRARRRSGYPSGARHELLSVALVEGAAAFHERAHDWDLVLHLIASHHGYCRPLPPVAVDRKPLEVRKKHDGVAMAALTDHGLEHVGSVIADRYRRVTRRYGWWGLARLEAILRLADHRRSQLERGL